MATTPARPITFEPERWAEALHVHMTYGVAAAQYIAERIARLATEHDQVGIDRWRAIGARVEQLAGGSTVQ